MNRRTALSTLGVAALTAGNGLAQQNPAPEKPPQDERLTPEVEAARLKARVRPVICLYSGCLAKIRYSELPEIVRGMGYEGIDLTVMQGGHVDPSKYMVELDRAFQTFQDAGIEVPMVTTNFTSASQPYAYAILYVSGQLGARFCRLGEWPSVSAGEPTGQNAAIRAVMMRNDLMQLATTSTRCNITSLLANHAGSYPGRSIPEAEAMLAGVPRNALGYCFDPGQAVIEARSAGGWEDALRVALPRLGAVALSDVKLTSDLKLPTAENGADGLPRLCALGEGVIDWKKFFAVLAAARFRGPISLHLDYEVQGPINAMKKDLAFVHGLMDEAWPL